MPDQPLQPLTALTINSSATYDQKVWILEAISLAERLKPGTPVLDLKAREALVNLYCALLIEIGQERFEEAFQRVLNSSKFRPDISELREAAGAPMQNPYHVQALEDLKTLFIIMREHGKTIRPTRQKDGSTLTPPRLNETTVLTCRELGFGDAYAGFEFVFNHPALDIARGLNETAELPFRSAEKIEAKFVQTWVKVNTK